MFASPSYNPFKNSLDYAKLVVGLELLYQSVKDQIGKFLFLCLVFVFALPMIFLFGFWLKNKRRTFQKHMRKPFPVLNNQSDYLKLKTSLNDLDSLVPSLKKVSNYKLEKTPWAVKFTLRQMQKMTSSIITYSDWQKTRLNNLNEAHFKSDNSVFKFVSEKELWQSRNQVYEYWM